MPGFFHKVRSVRRYFNKVNIRKQLYIVYFLAGILPIIAIGLYLLLNTRTLVFNQHYSQAKADNIRVRSIMLDVTISIMNISDDFFSDKQLYNVLAGDYKTQEESYAACRNYTKVNTIANRYSEISKINIYFNNKTMQNYGHFKEATEEVKATDWYKRAEASWSYHWVAVNTPDTLGNDVYEIALVRKIPVIQTGDFAVLFISISRNYLKSRINTSPLTTEIAVNSDPLFYSTHYGNIGQPLGMPINYAERFFNYEGIGKYDGSEALLEVSTLLMIKSQDKMYVATVDNQAVPNTNRITQVSGLIVVISLFAPFIMVSLFSKTFSARIRTLRQEMHKVSQGQLDIIEEFRGNDELVDLYTDLKTMIAKIKQTDQEIYQEKIARQKLINHQQQMKFELLTSQINPHFLFNTLETIRMKAYGAGDTDVSSAILLLAKSMRYVLDTSGKVTTLQSELDYIAVYLDIQKLRFKERMNYSIRVEEPIDPLKYKILSLLIQPIVENAFIHGLESRERDGHIAISIKEQDNSLLIHIADNGVGMTEEKLAFLIERMKTPRDEPIHKSIGLHNIYQRIKLYYGEEYGLEIESTLNVGTRVTVSLPLESSLEAN